LSAVADALGSGRSVDESYRADIACHLCTRHAISEPARRTSAPQTAVSAAHGAVVVTCGTTAAASTVAWCAVTSERARVTPTGPEDAIARQTSPMPASARTTPTN